MTYQTQGAPGAPTPNEVRAANALAAMEAYERASGIPEESRPPNPSFIDALPEDYAVDLVADLMHLCHLSGVDWGRVKRMAESHFLAESGGK